MKAKDGTLTREAAMANTICWIHSTLGGGESAGMKMIHVTSHTHCFKLQEAMILAEAYAESRQQSSPLKQVTVVLNF